MLVLWSALGCAAPAGNASPGTVAEAYAGRTVLVHLPQRMVPGSALVVVLHGGFGNAERISARRSEGGLNLDDAADAAGFIVAYLNGTPVSQRLGDGYLAWNAGGGCCGLPARLDVDDVGYIKGAVEQLAARYHIDRARVYGIGHSNGAMMTLRVLCETGLYAAAIAIAGPLNMPDARCDAARGRAVLAVHGEADENVPLGGGHGNKSLSLTPYNSEEHSRQAFLRAGASYELVALPATDHPLDHVEAAMLRRDGLTIAQQAVRFFGLTAPSE
jgi:polyhydroxybutyrate depolymerase